MSYNADVMEASLQRVEDFYLGDGWYSDGAGKRMDYYILFAIHFYSLIYAGLMSEFYNGPGSPYWAMKTFLSLVVAEDHPFKMTKSLNGSS